jgi:hypothetical protein
VRGSLPYEVPEAYQLGKFILESMETFKEAELKDKAFTRALGRAVILRFILPPANDLSNSEAAIKRRKYDRVRKEEERVQSE